MNRLIINTEAELLAAIDANRNLCFAGHIEVNISILLAHKIASISARDISARGNIKTQCILGIKLLGTLKCRAVVPASCAAWDREFWADRFGIDTSNGCWDEFVERLAVAAPKLLKKKHWLPIERLMIESSMGKYNTITSEDKT